MRPVLIVQERKEAVTGTDDPDLTEDRSVEGFRMKDLYFFRMRINRSYEAVFDPRTMISVMSPQVAESYKSRILMNWRLGVLLGILLTSLGS